MTKSVCCSHGKCGYVYFILYNFFYKYLQCISSVKPQSKSGLHIRDDYGNKSCQTLYSVFVIPCDQYGGPDYYDRVFLPLLFY